MVKLLKVSVPLLLIPEPDEDMVIVLPIGEKVIPELTAKVPATAKLPEGCVEGVPAIV